MWNSNRKRGIIKLRLSYTSVEFEGENEFKTSLAKHISDSSPPTWQRLVLQHSNLHLARRELPKTTYFKHHIITKTTGEPFMQFILETVSKVLDHPWHEWRRSRPDWDRIFKTDRQADYIYVSAWNDDVWWENSYSVWCSLLVHLDALNPWLCWTPVRSSHLPAWKYHRKLLSSAQKCN